MLSFLLLLSSWALKIANWVFERIFHHPYSVRYENFILATAILDFRRKWTSRDTGSGTVEKLVPENMGIAVGILLLCAVELEIRLGHFTPPPVAGERRKKVVAGTRAKAPTCTFGSGGRSAVWEIRGPYKTVT